MATVKDQRLAVRLSDEHRQLIDRAAETQGQTVTDFAVETLLDRARDILADRRLFVVDDQAWAEFNAILDRPATDKPALSRLLTRDSVFDE